MKKPMPVPRSGSVGVVPLLLVFCLAYVLGLMSSATFQNVYFHNILSQLLPVSSRLESPLPSPPPPPETAPCTLPPSPPAERLPSTLPPPAPSTTPLEVRRMSFADFLAPTGGGVMHNMTDEELLWRASMAPRMKSMPKHVIVPKIAFLFLVRGDMPLRPLWDKFFEGHEGLYSIYVHASPGYTGSPPPDSPFFGRMIPSQRTSWGNNLLDAERRLLGNGLLDLSNAHFALLSESCIPLLDFPTVYAYITGSNTNFVDSFDREESRLRHMPFFAQHNISLAQWRKGAQWFAMDRVFALEVISDETYYGPVFRNGEHEFKFMEEHYIPTLVTILGLGSRNSNRSLMYSDWRHPRTAHPKSHSGSEVTEELIREMKRGMHGNCSYNGGVAEFCNLFARKFKPDALEPLLDLAPKVMGFG